MNPDFPILRPWNNYLQPPIGLGYQHRVASDFTELPIFLQSISSRREMEAGAKLKVAKDLQLR